MRPCPHFISGRWTPAGESPTGPVFNPSLGAQIAEVPLASAALVDEAVRSADSAFGQWSETPATDRVQFLFRYKALLEKHASELATLVSTEHGKTLAEARGDVRRGIQMVEYATGIPPLLMGESLENIARGIDCDSIRQPLGVCTGITPFNFPAMVPLWMFPLALASGNTFVLKPSEKVPLTAVRLTELLLETGLPGGVFQLVHGNHNTVDALITHPLVRAVSFVGSTPVAREVFIKASAHGKRVQAAGGAKNFVVLMPDAPVDEAVRGLSEAAFGCAGERCMAGSMAIAVGGAGDNIVPALADTAKRVRVGPTFNDPEVQMGPVITATHRDRVETLITASCSEGADIPADGRGLRLTNAPNGFFVGPTILDNVRPDTTPMREEIFGPVLSIIRCDNLGEAIDIANRSAFGNGAAIFTRSGHAAREFRHRVRAGMVGINVGVPAPMAMFPFSGWNESFFGDLHIQGHEGIAFYTRQKVTTSRWIGDNDVRSR
jgi:malonate-semialdehyde dehydrogenase (acetylating)/methylmalonate-semialdehyde dehydrogenase